MQEDDFLVCCLEAGDFRVFDKLVVESGIAFGEVVNSEDSQFLVQSVGESVLETAEPIIIIKGVMVL